MSKEEGNFKITLFNPFPFQMRNSNGSMRSWSALTAHSTIRPPPSLLLTFSNSVYLAFAQFFSLSSAWNIFTLPPGPPLLAEKTTQTSRPVPSSVRLPSCHHLWDETPHSPWGQHSDPTLPARGARGVAAPTQENYSKRSVTLSIFFLSWSSPSPALNFRSWLTSPSPWEATSSWPPWPHCHSAWGTPAARSMADSEAVGRKWASFPARALASKFQL